MSWITPDLIGSAEHSQSGGDSAGGRHLRGLHEGGFGETSSAGSFQGMDQTVGYKGGSLQLVARYDQECSLKDPEDTRIASSLPAAPMIAFTSLLLSFAIVPVGSLIGWWPLPNIGILFFLMMAGLAVLRGVRRLVERNKYSLLGAMRASAGELRSVLGLPDGRGGAGRFI